MGHPGTGKRSCKKRRRRIYTPEERWHVVGLKTFLGSESIVAKKSFLNTFIMRIEVNLPWVSIDYTIPLWPQKKVESLVRDSASDLLAPRRERYSNSSSWYFANDRVQDKAGIGMTNEHALHREKEFDNQTGISISLS